MRRSWFNFLVIAAVACALTSVAATVRRINRDKRELPEASAQGSDIKTDTNRVSPAAPEHESHVVRLLTPADPQFDSVLDSAYPGLRTISPFQALRPNTILVTNESGQPVHAFVIKWTSQADGAMPAVTYTPYLKSAGRDRLVTQGVVLAPDEVRLLSPSFAFLRGQSLSALSTQMRANPSVSKVDTVVSGSLDGVIFEDGTFVGPDEAKLRDRFECERNGQHDEGHSMTLALQQQLSDDEITVKLNEHIKKGWRYRRGTDRESFYHVSRGNEAQLLLQLLKQSGRAKFEYAVTRIAKMNRTQLRKL